MRRLEHLRLCQAADFRRVRRRVRYLACDLPAFDSVWLDALVQARILTPYQARQIEREQAEDLVVDGWIIQEELGRGPHGVTFRAAARRRETGVLKRLVVAPEAVPDCHARLTSAMHRAEGYVHPHVVIPYRLIQPAMDELVTVSRLVCGPALAELMVRRGRLPAHIVWEIGRQLASGLAALHSLGLVHGDVQVSNVRLTPSGRAVLVDGLIRPALSPQFSIHDCHSLETCDGVAPERIGTGLAADVSSETYALGCLLWQLLAGSPPYAMADPLMKLAAHQSERIPDVRSLAPETPAELAESIWGMTAPDWNERPRTLDDVLGRWGRPGWGGRSRVRQYRRDFDGAVPHLAQTAPRSATRPWPWVAALLFVSSGIAFSLADRGLQNQLLTIAGQWSNSAAPPAETPDSGESPDPAPTVAGLRPLPAPTGSGEILLTDSGTYEAARVTVDGPLTIRCAAGVTAEILVTDEPLTLGAVSVVLDGVRIRTEDPTVQLTALVLVKSQQLRIRSSVLDAEFSSERTGARGPGTVLAWRPLHSGSDAETTEIGLENSILHGPGTGIWCATAPDHVAINHCLHRVLGPSVQVNPRSQPGPLRVTMTATTLRHSGPLVRLPLAASAGMQLDIRAENCVFDLARSTGALVELQASQAPEGALGERIRVNGTGSVLCTDRELVAWTGEANPTPLDADDVFTGLVVSDLVFAGTELRSVAAARLESLTAPRSANVELPGIDPRRMPDWPMRPVPDTAQQKSPALR